MEDTSVFERIDKILQIAFITIDENVKTHNLLYIIILLLSVNIILTAINLFKKRK